MSNDGYNMRAKEVGVHWLGTDEGNVRSDVLHTLITDQERIYGGREGNSLPASAPQL